ncbi:5'-nucleotidase C-terminal domain-containing protein [Flavobacterium sp. J27]|uniref:5'-nucleotidase C-terminal domain-containing protein n=1 Tax=Flavobacterium sp. J27 TaxID=2060419 RepID=UPI00102FABA3|nr:5'-nucleotidase [Flavobacterium sp. J27]
MVNVKKKRVNTSYFVILLTLATLISCKTNQKNVYEIEGKRININEQYPTDVAIENFIAPYRKHINNDLDSILAFNPVTQEKSTGKWQTNIGNLFAETTLELSNPIFNKREHKNIDFCLLNHGGIRSIIPQGNVTTRTAFEIMPFENSVIVVGLSGKEVKTLAAYFLKEKKPHPLAGLTIFTDKEESQIIDLSVNGKPIDETKTYYIATSDYLANGGDNMNFFRDSSIKYDLDYKLRNLFIDYFKKTDTIPNITTERVIIK